MISPKDITALESEPKYFIPLQGENMPFPAWSPFSGLSHGSRLSFRCGADFPAAQGHALCVWSTTVILSP